jgi:hypothetical protein
MAFSGSIMSDGKASGTGVSLFFSEHFTIDVAENSPPRITISALNASALWSAYLTALGSGPFKLAMSGGNAGSYVRLIGYSAADNGSALQQSIDELTFELWCDSGKVFLQGRGTLLPLPKSEYGAYYSAKDGTSFFRFDCSLDEIEFLRLIVKGIPWITTGAHFVEKQIARLEAQRQGDG